MSFHAHKSLLQELPMASNVTFYDKLQPLMSFCPLFPAPTSPESATQELEMRYLGLTDFQVAMQGFVLQKALLFEHQEEHVTICIHSGFSVWHLGVQFVVVDQCVWKICVAFGNGGCGISVFIQPKV